MDDFNISAVLEGIEPVVPAVREGNVLEQAKAVHLRVSNLLHVRDQVDVREAQALEPALVLRVPGLPGELRMGVHVVCAVHAAGAAPHHHPVEALDELFEPNLVQELVLGGDMTAAQHNPMGPTHQFRGLRGIPPVQHHNFFRVDTGLVDALTHALEDGVRETAVVRGGAHQEHAGFVSGCSPGPLNGQGQLRFDIGPKAVVLREMRLPVTGGTACEVQNHEHKYTNSPPHPQKTSPGANRRTLWYEDSRISPTGRSA